MLHERVESRDWGFAIIAASGPSLTPEVAEKCRGYHCIAVNDAHRLVPFADVLYGCDRKWWDNERPTFAGEKWSSHRLLPGSPDDKLECAEEHGLDLVYGKYAPEEGFSLDPRWIHYGQNSGYQAINLAMHFGARVIALVGFNMQRVGGQAHFYGNRKGPLTSGDYPGYVQEFERSARLLPDHIQIVNCTSQSLLTCFPKGTPDDFADLARLGQGHGLSADAGRDQVAAAH